MPPSPKSDYADLEVRIFSRQERAYPVEITLDGQQEFQRGQLPGEIIPWVPSGSPLTDGKKLLDMLLSDPALQNAWSQARGSALQRRIRLRIDPGAAELHNIPWELLSEDNVTLSAAAQTPFSRYLPVALPWGNTAEERPIRVLAVISSPEDIQSQYNLTPLDTILERQTLEAAFSGLGAAAEIHFLEAPVTLERLEEELRQGYHILHYLGHGAFSPRRGQAALYLQTEGGQTQIVNDEAVIGMLARQQKRPSLVFLAACQSAARSTADAFLGLAPKLVTAGVPAVVAMQDFVDMETARKLSAAFYQRLAEHGTVDRALNEARSVLLTASRPDAAVPVLFMRLKSGQLWSAEADARGQVLDKNPRAFWTTLVRQIQQKRCTPIIGPRAFGRVLPSQAEIAANWAEEHSYPFTNRTDMARVAQYLATSQGEAFPRAELLDAMKNGLIQRLPEALRPTRKVPTLTDCIQAVGWQNLVADDPNNVQRVLAAFDLPIYMTTNPDSLMVEALRARGAEPLRELCRWGEQLDWLESALGPDYQPSAENPLVYHLFGSDEQEDSLILTEDDYFNFLVRTASERDRIPNFIREALSSTSLMFVGYSLYDWEFRVLLHGLVASRDTRRKFKHVAVQLDLSDSVSGDTAAVQSFLQQYFLEADINVYWGTMEQFIAELREQWEAVK